MPDDNLVTIPRDRLAQLQYDALKYRCLSVGGVDNWEGYDEALREGGFFREDVRVEVGEDYF